MNQLTSKIQYKNVELGEFIEEKKRSFEETIELFPCECQRENIVIGLANPSITIHGKSNDYLKLTLFYNGKFVLHYFDQGKRLFTRSISAFKDAYTDIKNYFNTTVFDSSNFRKENTIFQNNLKHFLSQRFRYTVTSDSIRKYLLSSSAISFAFTFFIIFFFLIEPDSQISALGVAAILLMVFFVGGELNLSFFNYYEYAKNKVLIMSKGTDIFYFGDKENPAKYNKGEILRFIISRVRSSRSPISRFTVVTIELKNGNDIDIPDILLDH